MSERSRNMKDVMKMKVIGYLALSLAVLSCSPNASAQQPKQSFTIADEIGLTLFDAQGLVWPSAIHFSPDGKHVAVWTERGTDIEPGAISAPDNRG